MNPHRVEDYLSELLGMPPAIAPPPPAAADDSISEDEFEALLDALHGGAAPGTATAPAVAPSAPAAASAGAIAPPPAAPLSAAPSTPAAAPAGAIAPPPAVTGGEPRSSRWLRLRVHQQNYAVELLRVQEVLLPVAVLALRDTEPALRGVMNLRGVVVPVLDLGLWLELEEVSDTPQTRFVVLEHNGDSLALKVSAVLDVHAVADREIEPAEHTLVDASVAQLRGVARLNGQPVILLDALGLLG
ncbi:MAG: purine-binding chemotaxis protein CheW [Xanthomonadaceae bacterium]|nr:purine-binding chemotaxis protein CheW [Xanthomonadaceae bacterium]